MTAIRFEIRLFAEEPLREFLAKRTWEVKNHIDELGEAVVLGTEENEIIEPIFEHFRVQPPAIDFSGVTVSMYDKSVRGRDVPSDIPGIRRDVPHQAKYQVQTCVYYLPYTGDKTLFRYQPQCPSTRAIKAYVTPDLLCFEVEDFYGRPERVKQEGIEIQDQIRRTLDCFKQDLERFSTELRVLISGLLQQRKGRLLGTDPLLAAIGLPVKRRSDLPTAYLVPELPKKLPILSSSRDKITGKNESLLGMEAYKEILQVIGNMALAMERSPRTFAKLQEEEIRDFFLIFLNGYFEGQATGETFNVSGKTDILVRVANQNIFIAECKFWGGPKSFKSALEQLFGYLSWRDTKAAIIVFNRIRQSDTVMLKVDEVVQAHPAFRGPYELGTSNFGRASVRSYILTQPGASKLELTLTVMVFDIPSASE